MEGRWDLVHDGRRDDLRVGGRVHLGIEFMKCKCGNDAVIEHRGDRVCVECRRVGLGPRYEKLLKTQRDKLSVLERKARRAEDAI